MSPTPTGRAQWSPEQLAALGKTMVAIVVAGLLVGVFALSANLYYVAAIVGGIAITMLIVWQFEAVLLIYVLVAFMPWGRTPDLATGGSGEGKGIFVSEALLAYILSVWLIRYLLRLVPKISRPSGFDKPIIIYIIYSLLCTVNGFIFWDSHVDRMYQHPSVNIIELGLRFLSAGAFVIAATSISNAKWLKRLAIVAFVPGLFSLADATTGSHMPIKATWWPILMLMPASYCCAVALDKGSGRLSRTLSIAVVCISIFAILVKSIAWVSGWLGLIAALSAVLFIKSRKLFIACLVVSGIAMVLMQPLIRDRVLVESAESGDYDRFALMKGALRYATTFPLGVGPGNYRSYNSFYYGEKWGTTVYTSAHGTYSQHLAEMGVPGLLLFIAIPAGGAWWLLTSHRRMKDGFARTFVLATIGQLVGVCTAALVGDYIIPTYHNGGLMTFSTTVYSWITWGIAVACIRISDKETYEPVNSDSQLEYTEPAGPVSALDLRDSARYRG